MLTEETFDTGEVSLNVMRGPANGPPLLLLHGVLRRWSDFVPVLPALIDRWQVFGVDFRGHGESGFTTGHYLVSDYVRDSVAIVRELLSEPCVVYGHSLGAMVAAGTAAEAPDRVRALVLEDPPFETMGNRILGTMFHSQFKGYDDLLEPEMPPAKLAALLAEMKIEIPGRSDPVRLGDLRDGCSLRYMASCLAQIDPDVLSPVIEARWLEGYDWEKVLSAVHCPTLLLQGDTSVGGMLMDDDARRSRELIADCIVMSFPKVGHLIHWMAPADLLRSVLSFLESLR